MSWPESTSLPPIQSTAVTAEKVVKVITPKKVARTRARCSDAVTTRPTRVAKRSRSYGSCANPCTTRIWPNASSASAVESAS